VSCFVTKNCGCFLPVADMMMVGLQKCCSLHVLLIVVFSLLLLIFILLLFIFIFLILLVVIPIFLLFLLVVDDRGQRLLRLKEVLT